MIFIVWYVLSIFENQGLGVLGVFFAFYRKK